MSASNAPTEPNEIVLSVILPVRNDAPSVNVMVRILMAMIEVPCEILVVYDDPDDTTVPVIETLKLQHHNLIGMLNAGRGVLNAVRTGVAAARGRYILIYAADEIGPVLVVGRMIELMELGCDFVSGTRYSGGGRRYGGSVVGHLLSRTANILFRLMSATALSDCTTGIKMFRRELFPKFQLSKDAGGWSFAFEMAICAQLMGLKLSEVPLVSIDRLFGGTSTFKPIPWIIYYSKWFIWGIRKLPPWYRPRPRLATELQRCCHNPP